MRSHDEIGHGVAVDNVNYLIPVATPVESEAQIAAIADGMGAVGIRVATAEELEAALQEAERRNADGTTVLIDVAANVEARRSPTAPPA